MGDGLLLSALFGAVAGAMIPIGAIIARFESFRDDWLETEFRHSVMAFGAGVLVAAVALVLIPEGARGMPPLGAVAAFLAGGAFFAWLDSRLSRGAGSKAQLLAMVSDFFPEALALGAMVAAGEPGAALLAMLIGLQNLPEGFNAYREAIDGGKRPGATMMSFILLACLGPLAAVSGHLFLDISSWLTSTVMLAAAGGILFLMFQDIAPKAHVEGSSAPSLAALGGFAFGLLGNLILA